MKRRDFLERVSELAKGAAAGVTLSKLQIAAVAASLTTVACTKENPVSNTETKEKLESSSTCPKDKTNVIYCIALVASGAAGGSSAN